MFTRFMAIAIAVAISVVPTGCTMHRALRKNMVHQAQTVSDIHQQQVLNNVAKFVYNPYSLPDFAWPKEGAADINDSGDLSFGLKWVTAGFDSATLGGSGKRSAKESWTLTPINDPRKLELMRCSYQRAVSACGYASESTKCPDCSKRWSEFYTGDTKYEKPEVSKDGKVLNEDPGLRARMEGLKEHQKKTGVVNSECLYSGCWFCVCCKKCLPKGCDRKYVGQYCDVFVYVPPEGRDQLTRLTLAILDYAVNDPPKGRSKEVVAYLQADGSNATRSTAERRVTAVIPITTDLDALLKLEARKRAAEQKRKREAEEELASVEREMEEETARARNEAGWGPNKEDELKELLRPLNDRKKYLESVRDHIDPQLELLPPTRTEVPGPNYLQFNQRLQTLTPN